MPKNRLALFLDNTSAYEGSKELLVTEDAFFDVSQHSEARIDACVHIQVIDHCPEQEILHGCRLRVAFYHHERIAAFKRDTCDHLPKLRHCQWPLGRYLPSF